MLVRGVILAFIVMGSAQAQEANVPLPQPRPDMDVSGDTLPMPRPRPQAAQPAAAADRDAPEQDVERVYQAACPALLSGRVRGAIAPPENEGACGIQSPIAIEALDIGERTVAVSGRAAVNCAMATALRDWAEEVSNYAQAVLGSPLAEIDTGPGYVCRRRNNAEDGFVSEHGFGNALDIVAVTLEDGRRYSVLEDWSVSPLEENEKFLGFAHAAACGRFTTVLGPEANSLHEDHFHFDLGCHGQSCTAQICE